MRDAQLPCVFPGSPWLLVENGGGGLKMPKTGMLERLRGWLAEHVGVRRQAVWEKREAGLAGVKVGGQGRWLET